MYERGPSCETCQGPTVYCGQVERPPRTIYRCELCGHEMWSRTMPRPPPLRIRNRRRNS